MDYKEYEYIFFFMNIAIDGNRNRLTFGFNKNNRHQCYIVNKYKDMPPEEFMKEVKAYSKKDWIIGKKRLNKFKQLKTSDFSAMSLERKLQYIKAISDHPYSKEEWITLFTEIKDNLRACLFSLQPDKKFLLEEQRNLNHFMNALIGVGLDKAIKGATKKTPKEQKQDLHDFMSLFCKVYEMPEPDLKFGKFNALGSCYKDQHFKCTVRIDNSLLKDAEKNSFRNFEILFHELVHVRQSYLQLFNGDKHPTFSWIFDNLENLINEKYFDLDTYSLLPKEGHAYYMQHKFEELCEERIFNNKPHNKEKLNYSFSQARTLWFDYKKLDKTKRAL